MDTFLVAIHFVHRTGALLVTLAAVTFIGSIIATRPVGGSLAACGILAALIGFQIALGAHIIWLARPPMTTTLHVVTGAAILAWSLRMALGVRSPALSPAHEARAAMTVEVPA
jgi:cytochrome c oxidase assembly protein subunit 15